MRNKFKIKLLSIIDVLVFLLFLPLSVSANVYENKMAVISFNYSDSCFAQSSDVASTASNSGLARKILNKNNEKGLNLLTQKMLNGANTIYEIQYDFVLGSNIVIPENCIIDFNGGSISSNGAYKKIVGNNTIIRAEAVRIFDANVVLDGTWKVFDSYPEWFGAISNSKNDAAPAIQSCINSFNRVLINGSFNVNSTLLLLNNTELIGKGVYNANLFFGENVTIGIAQHPNITTLRGATIKNIVLSKDKVSNNSSGIYLKRASQINIESVTAIRFSYGFDLNCFYVGTIKKCDATQCGIGFYFGRNDGNSTSTTIESCYALKCDVGYILKRLNYSMLTSCACDESRIAYDFWHSNVTLNNCGCELIGERIISLDMHSEDDVLLNKCGNMVSINDFQAIECQGNVPPILISAGTRLADDRNIVNINGLYLGVNKDARIDKLIQYSGDTQLYLSRISTPYGKIPLFENTSKGVPFNAYACSQIYVEGKRYVTLPLLEKVVKSRVGEVAYVHMNNTFVECYWNGVKWVDNKGFSIGMHKGKKSLRPKGRAAGDSSLHILDANDIGYEYYDTSINKLIYVKSVDSKGMVIWVDAMGNVMP